MSPSSFVELPRCDQLPSIPAIAQKILGLRRDPNTDFYAVASVLQKDPVISAMLLKWANSPYYGQAHVYESVLAAVRLFGIKDSLTLALNFTLIDCLRAIDHHSLDYDWFWRRSLLSAVFARNLAKYLGRNDDEELFLAALLQDIGMLALDRTTPSLYLGLDTVKDYHEEAVKNESECFGSNHAVLGGQLLSEWGLPESLVLAISRSHDFELTKSLDHCNEFQRIVMISALFSELWIHPDWKQKYHQVLSEGYSLLGLSVEDVLCIIDTTDQDAQDVAALFNIVLLGPNETQALLSEAAQETLAK